jgi:hypothetical protein
MHAGWIDGLSVRGAYDFDRILSDPAIAGEYNQNYKKWFFKLHKSYIRKMEELVKEIREPASAEPIEKTMPIY